MEVTESSNLINHAVAAGEPTVKAMAPGAITTALGWLVSSQGIAMLGFFLTIAGFTLNLIFQLRRDRRETEWQRAQLALLAQQHQDSK
jgi:hypothetical protein